MLASEALEITNGNRYKNDAVNYNIKYLENRIKKCAEMGKRNCMIDFYGYPGKYTDFIEKYGEENSNHYKEYDLETDLREYFDRNGFQFKKVTDDVCGGVRQAPYWVICW